ncbi:hypothetical protein PIB30_039613 [Stylosanthes scabra]|uniref:Uncharacterized protein n=1 Tax=Stylosanthes scabra TaxID=79078 RepID=A0ABU6QEG1_9FABA|nr:hypothetical protein [Stylosanthes scabra]
MSPATLSLPFPLPTPTSRTRHQSRQPTTITSAAARRPRQKTTVKTDNKEQRQTRSSSSNNNNNSGFGASEKKEAQWRCVESCGACCKLDKGPSFPSPEEIFTDPSHVQHYKSLIGPDGWCIHYEKSTRKCSIYSGDRLS